MNTQYRKFKGDLSLKEIKNKNLLDSRDLAFEKLQEEVYKYKEVLDKIKEYIKENANANVDYILELLEEIE